MRILYFLLFVSVLSSCKNELEIYGDNYVETAVVYGVIDLVNDSQAIRVNKTFRNTSSAAETLKIYDSLCFENIQVMFTCYPSGKTVILKAIERPEKHSSRRDIFSVSTSELEPSFTSIKLTVINLNTGNTFTSTTSNTPPPTYSYPRSNNVIEGENSIPFGNQYNSLFHYSSFFDGIVRMFYTEYPPDAPSDSVQLYVDYVIPPIDLTNVNIPQSNVFKYTGTEVIRTAQVVIGTTNKTRVFRGFSTYISAESDNMSNYLHQQIPSIHTVQKNPFFSNIEGGIGLFTSRGTAVRTQLQPSTGMAKLLKDKLNIDL